MKYTKFKKGDKVVCKPGYTTSDVGDRRGGNGYKEGREFIIDNFSDDNDICWDDDMIGVWTQAIELVIKQGTYEIY